MINQQSEYYLDSCSVTKFGEFKRPLFKDQKYLELLTFLWRSCLILTHYRHVLAKSPQYYRLEVSLAFLDFYHFQKDRS